MTKVQILILMPLLIYTGQSFAQTSQESFSAEINMAYATQYMIDGFNVGGDSPVTELSAALLFPSKKFSVMYWSALQTDRDDDRFDEQDFFLLYHDVFQKESRVAFDFHSFYDYWLYPNTLPVKDGFGDTVSDVQRHGSKVQIGVSMLNLWPISESFLIPTYNINYWIYWNDDHVNQYEGGAEHQFLLTYTHWVPRPVVWLKDVYAGGSASMNYIDGAFDVGSGWSHSTASLLSGFKTVGINFDASITRQWSYMPTVDVNNELWSQVSVRKEF